MEEVMLNIPTAVNLIGILLCVALWAGLYHVLCQLNSGCSREWNCRLVTAVHAVILVCLSGWCAFVQGPWPFTHPGGPNTALQQLSVMLSLGYFIFDFTWCLHMGTEGPVMLVHHFLSILGQSVTVLRQLYGTEMVATIFGTELTNPFLQMRWFLRERNKHHTWYAEVNDLLFMGLFGFLRIGVASNLLYCYLHHSRPDMFGKLGGCCIYTIGWVFWVQIVRYAIRKYTKRYRNHRATTDKQRHHVNGYINGTSSKTDKVKTS